MANHDAWPDELYEADEWPDEIAQPRLPMVFGRWNVTGVSKVFVNGHLIGETKGSVRIITKDGISEEVERKDEGE